MKHFFGVVTEWMRMRAPPLPHHHRVWLFSTFAACHSVERSQFNHKHSMLIELFGRVHTLSLPLPPPHLNFTVLNQIFLLVLFLLLKEPRRAHTGLFAL